jgi:hypothetical protein
MPEQKFNPWWERVNDYYIFDERKEFVRGATSYRPNNRQEAMVAQLMTGYVSDSMVNLPKPIGRTGEDRHSK